jgi:hypothetical protein
MSLPISQRDDLDLCDAADFLYKEYGMRKSAGDDVSPVVRAHSEVAAEMRKRSLLYNPLEVRKDWLCPKCHSAMSGNSCTGDGCGYTKAVSFPDDGIHTKSGTKSGKGGEKNRTQDKIAASVDGDTDDENTGEGWTTKKVTTMWKNVGTYAEFRKAADNDEPTPHEFFPVRNVCRVCRKGAETHVAKALGIDGSIWFGGVDERLFDPQDAPNFAKALRQFSTDERKDMADKGIALPDGSFPIPDEAHLHAAIRLIGQAPDPQSAMNHTIERAQTMGMEHALPEAWGVQPGGTPGAPVIGDGAHSLGNGVQPQTAPNAGPAKAMPGDGSAGPGGPGGPGGAAPSPGGAGAGALPGADGGQPTPEMGGAPEEDLTKPVVKPTGIMKRMAKAMGRAMSGTGGFDEQVFLKSMEAEFDATLPYDVIKSDSELRYTLGPVYEPNVQDAHGEWTTTDDLRKAAMDYVTDTGHDRSVFLQHSTEVAGHWSDSVIWPTAVEARLMKSIDGVMKSEVTTFAPDTWYMGVVWEPWAWEEVKKGHITGFSMGGHAHRLEGSPA